MPWQQPVTNKQNTIESPNVDSTYVISITVNGPSLCAVVLGYRTSLDDLEFDKNMFDNAMLNEKFDILTSIVWEFDMTVNFAGSGLEGPTYDLRGNSIQDLTDMNTQVKHYFIIVFPEEDKTYCVISWAKENDSLFGGFREQLLSLTEEKRKIFINVTLPTMAENIVMKPSSFDQWHSRQKNDFMEKVFKFDNLQFNNRMQEPLYDLFSL